MDNAHAPAHAATRVVADQAAIAAAIHALVDAIQTAPVERSQSNSADYRAAPLALVGVHTGGVPLAQRLAKRLESRLQREVPVGMVDIALYRDDVGMGLLHPLVGETRLPFDVTGKRLVLVDDVFYTGRTARAALAAIVDFGRPRRIELAVLADRGHRELPIRPDHTGFFVTTSRDERLKLELTELGAPVDRLAVFGSPATSAGGSEESP